MDIKVSVVIPVYNAEKTLRRCLNTILLQTLPEYEVICVNDGSFDTSLEILSEYAEKNNCIKIVNQNNNGVSIARQVGLNSARGEYIIHADPDDWVEPNWLQSLYDEAVSSNADMTICDFERIYKDRTVRFNEKPDSLNPEEVLYEMLIGKLWGACWNKLVRKKCFDNWNIQFVPSMNLCEDLFVNSMLLINGATVSYVPQVLYHYDSYTNSNSIVQHRKDAHISSGIYLIDNLQAILPEDKYDDCLFYRKSRIKSWIFDVYKSNYNIVNTYSEINERYVKEAGCKPSFSKEKCIALCIKGHPKLGHFIFNVALLIYKFYNKLKNV